MKRKIQMPKKILSVFLCVLVVFSCVPMSVISVSAEDLTGLSDLTVTIDTDAEVTLKDIDADSYYDIGTADELYAFAYAVNGGNFYINGEFTADIVVNEGVMTAETDSTAVRHWTPIGNSDNPYLGEFNGQNHTVSGLYFNDTTSGEVGLFGFLGWDGIIRNVGVFNSYIKAKEDVGGVLGYTSAKTAMVINCYNESTIIGANSVGGVVGSYGPGTVMNCHNTGAIMGGYDVGGVAGYCWQAYDGSKGYMENCYNHGTVTSDGSGYPYKDIYCAGGIVGYACGEIANCYNTGKVSGKYAGAIAGYDYNIVSNCYYLTTTAEKAVAYHGESSVFDATEVTLETLKSGEVAYLLQGEQTDEIWGQKIGTDELPVLGGDKVYFGYNSCADEATAVYTNNANATAEKPNHDWKDGTCLVCSKVCSHTWENGVCSVCTKVCKHDWDSYGACTICSLECAHKELRVEFEWDEPYQGECYVYMELYCDECGYYVTSDSGYFTVKETVEGEDCLHEDLKTYEASFEYEGVTYTDTKEFGVKSEKHTAMNADGFCSACGRYQPAKYNEEADVYEISNAGQLYWYAQKLNDENPEIHAKLTKDIVIPEDAPEWVPINCSYAYFDGNFKTISGLKSIGGEYDTYVGLFGNEGWWYEISNLHITNSYFEGKDCVGAVVACMSNGGNVTNCYVTNTTVKGDSGNVGTLVGYLTNSHIINSYVDTDTLVGYHNDSYGSIENSYYLADEETDSYDGTTAKTAKAFASGEVAYLLQGEQTEDIWGQKLGTDELPTLGGDKVYYVTNCKNENIYSNTNENGQHSFENGFCSVCKGYQSATRNADGYYEIGNAGQLYWFADKVNNDYENFGSANAILTADIVVNEGVMTAETDSTAVRHWTPMGNYDNQYTGTFNGNNHTVSGLYINNTETDYVGLFGFIGENGAVENTDVINSYFNGNYYVGGVAGINIGTITNCDNTGEVSGFVAVGGVVGYNNYGGIITNCYNTGSVNGDGYVGGVVGNNLGDTITNCYNTGTVSGDECVGGVVGNNDGTITNCYNTGDINGSWYVGGVVGNNLGDTITNCYNTGDVSGDYHVGGVVGTSYGTITNCYNTGDVIGYDYVGGVLGYNNDGTITTNCYYLDTACTGGINGADVKGSAEAKTADQFASGEVAYLLQAGVTADENGDIPEIWGQKIGTESYPLFGSTKVYAVINCKGEVLSYNNTKGEILDHNFENGFCTVCDAYEPATLNADGYYEIGNAGQLYWFADKVNNDYENFGSANAVLTADIVVNEGEMTAETDSTAVRHWTPISNNSKQYKGTFNGNNHTVSGIYFNNIKTNSDYIGLFSYIGTNGVVENTGVINSYFNGNDYVGGVVGYNYGTITNCYNTSKVSSIYVVGGVAGFNNKGTITNCSNTGDVNGDDYVGGMVGYNYGTITNCYNTGEVSGFRQIVGGMVGFNGGTVKNSYNTGAVSGNEHVGGVVSDNDGTITNCYNTGDVNGDDCVGGVVGENYGRITNCYYLDTACTGGINGADVKGSAEAKTAEQFASGEVAYLLQGEQTENIWGQKLGTDNYPKFGSDKVYYGYITCDETNDTIGYTNIVTSEEAKPDHNFVNGFCSVCKGYQPATLNADGYYEIDNAGKLYWFAEYVNAGNTSANAILTADIVVNEGKMISDTTGARVWTPIGNYDNQYTGTFNGNNHTVSGLYINNTGKDYVGLFGYIGTNGVVENTGVINSYFNGRYYIGGVVGDNYGTITNCYNTGKVSGYSNVGGVVGINDGIITNCYNTGDVSGYSDVGGVVGNNYGTITNCYNTGTVSGNKRVGGVVGNNKKTITNCYYLNTAYNGGINGADVKGSAEAKTAEQFASGEVAYLLQGEQTENIWGQKIGTESYPLFGSDKVYCVYQSCSDDDCVYTNNADDVTERPAHSFENGFCTVCDVYEPATLNADGYYKIDNAGQLYWFADKVNNDNENFGSANAILTADIVVNEGVMTAETDSTKVRHWTPISNNSKQYTGTFNGNNHTVSGLYFNNSEANNVGLFGCVGENGVVKNTGVINSYFNADYGVGGVVGDNYGTITNCYNTGKVSGEHYIGGVVGYDNEGTITNCYNTGTFSGIEDVGGVVGVNTGTITNCYNTGEVCGTNDIGGVVGYNYYSGTITNCYNTGEVSGTDYVGGVAGYNYYIGIITNCYNTGKVSGTDYVGGVAGYNREGTISNCYNTGTVSGTSYVGGVAGSNFIGTITNCYYLNTAYNGGINGADVKGSAKAKTANQFANGEVAYLLQSEQTENAWGQKISTDELPTFGGDKVYCIYQSCSDEDGIYTNNADDVIERPAHSFKNGFCTVCDAYEPATLNADGYYEIDNAGKLYWFAYKVNNYNENFGSANAILTADIVVNEGKMTAKTENAIVWTPIGYNSKQYTGTFNGNNHTVSGLYINNAETVYVGLFGYLGTNGAVENTGVINSYFNGDYSVGGVVGNNDGIITNCYNTGDVNGSDYYVGGVVGNNYGIITNCYNTGDVSGSDYYVGGVVGDNNGTITNCYNTGNVSGTKYVGGVVGYSYGTITNCYYLSANETDDLDGTTAKTADQFASGQVAYLLQAGVTVDENGDIPEIWGQKLDTDKLPVLGGEKVYYGYITCDEANDTIGYTNIVTSEETKPDHNFEKGFCTVCDAYEPAKLNTDGYYEIDNAGQLYWFADKVNNDNANFGSANAILTADIVVNEGEMTAETDSSKVRHWIPIGTSDTQYNGIFNGNNHIVSGIYLNTDAIRCVGLIGYTGENGVVENIGISNSYMISNYWGSNLGGVVGENHGKTTNCYNTSDFSAHDFIGRVGGVVGENYGTITNCYNTGHVNYVSVVGGVAGRNYGTITNCYNTGDINNENSHAGGVVAENHGAITNCNNSGNIKGCVSAGGIVGYSSGTIINCYNTGSISSIGISSQSYIGGIVGADNSGTITNCYNTGSVSSGEDFYESYIGGVVAQNRGSTITNCYNTGKVCGYDYVGVVSGFNYDGTITNCYYLSDSEVDELDGTTAKTAEAFASGEVAYLLQGEQTENIWGQKLGTDANPVFNGDKVYYVTNCNDENIYSNTNENGQHSFENGFCTACGAMDGIAQIKGYSISLGGNIAVNYYMALSDEVLADENAEMVFTVPNGDSTYEVRIPVKDVTPDENGYYMFTCEVAAKEMTSVISAKLVTSNAQSDVFEYSVKQYADYILANPDKYEKEIPLVKAMLNYGANAQLYFDHNTDNLANDSMYMTETDKALVETLDLSEYAYSIEGEQEGVSFYGAILSLKSETAIKLYFDFENEADVETLDITVDGKAVDGEAIKLEKNGKHYEIKISDIPANSLGKMFEIKVGNLTLNYCALSYGNVAMGTSKENLKNTIKAMYAYNQAAIEYLS